MNYSYFAIRKTRKKTMSDDPFATYREILKDTSHPYYEMAWLVFQDRMDLKYVSERLIDRQDKLTPLLLDILDNDNLILDTSLGQGMAPVHAAGILGEWRIKEAIPRLMELMETQDHESYIQGVSVVALGKMGAEIVPPILKFAETADTDLYSDIASILAEAGKQTTAAYDWVAARLIVQTDHWEIRYYAEMLMMIDYPTARRLIEERIRQRQYSKKLADELLSFVEEFEVI
jgi:hypothetical protein